MNNEKGQAVAVGSSDSSASDAVRWLGDTLDSCHRYERIMVTVSVRDLESAMSEIERLRGRVKWWIKNAEALTAERNELMNAGGNHAEIAARMKREIAEFFSSPNTKT